jgi:hypothetical protein
MELLFDQKTRRPLGCERPRHTAYAAWRDAGMLVLDVADRTQPTLIAHRNWSPPFGTYTTNAIDMATPYVSARAA